MRKTNIMTLVATLAIASSVSAQSIKVYKGDSIVGTYAIGTEADKVEFCPETAATASSFFDVDYWGDIYKTGTENFIIRLGDCPHDGTTPTGAGRIYNFSLFNSTLTDESTPMPAMGTYTMGEAGKAIDMTIEPSESLLSLITDYVSRDEYKMSRISYNDAKLELTDLGDGNYKVDATLTLSTGEEVNLSYTGKVTLEDRSFKGYTGPQLEKDLEFTADWATAYTYDGSYFEIMDGGDPSAEGASWYNRNRIRVQLEAGDKTAMTPPIGTFYVSNSGDEFTLPKGTFEDYGGGIYGSEGTVYYYVDPKTYKTTFGFIDSGSVTISKDESTGEYTISVNFVTNNGYKVKATYKGAFQAKS